MLKMNVPFIFVLTGVWLVLLALCALIGILIVPVDPVIDSTILDFLVSTWKVGLSLVIILAWLLGWYKMMGMLLNVEFYLAERSTAKDD